MPNKQVTGYPSIDKPWMKYYDESLIAQEMPACSTFEYVLRNNQANQNVVAINYLGKKITYSELFQNIRKVASAFQEIGVSQNEIVPIFMTNTPELIYSIYGLELIGAIPNLEYVTISETDIKSELNKTHSKTVVVLDLLYAVHKNAFESVENVIIVSPADSLPIIKKCLYMAKNKPIKASGNALQWKSFIERGKGAVLRPVPYSQEQTAVIIHSGGTTGQPKGVVLTHDNCNAIAFQYKFGGMSYQSGEKLLHGVPPFHAFGFSVGIHMPLCCGLTLYAPVKFDNDYLTDLFYKIKPVHFIGGPSHANAIINDRRAQTVKLENIKTFAVGGASVTESTECGINDFLKRVGANAKIVVGYGLSETCASICTERNDCWKAGSVGIPLIKTTVKVVGSENKELQYMESGELWFSTPSAMKGYYDNDSETQEMLFVDSSGSKWIKTGDIGYVDKEGFVFIRGRIKRIYATRTADGTLYKIFPDYIEKVMMENRCIEQAAVICIPDRKKLHKAIAFLRLKNGVDESHAQKEVSQYATKSLPPYDVPAEYVFVRQMPTTPVGKVDYRALEQMPMQDHK